MTMLDDPVDACVEEMLDGVERRRVTDRASQGEQQRNRLEWLAREQRGWLADLAELVAEVERTGTYVEDGHRSVIGWLRATTACSTSQAGRWRRVARLCQGLPVVLVSLREGRVGVEQVLELARVHANPRVRAHLPEYIDALLRDAGRVSFDEFRATMLQFERLLDEDGVEPRLDRGHESRHAWVHTDAISARLTASFGSTDGAEVEEILTRYCDAEFRTDCEAARARWGDDGFLGHLPRTAPQRAADALVQLFRDAAAARHGGPTSDPLLNITIDLATFEEIVADLAVDAADAGDLDDVVDALVRRSERQVADVAALSEGEDITATSATVPPPGQRPPRRARRHPEPRWWRCESQHGSPVPRRAALEAMLLGHVRRVVVDSAGVIVDAGRKRRLFTGVQRDLVMRLARWCPSAGCAVPARHCQADHTIDHRFGGTTSTDNGAPRCGHHNRSKNRGFTVWRDPEGYWHTYRPDGTEIG